MFGMLLCTIIGTVLICSFHLNIFVVQVCCKKKACNIMYMYAVHEACLFNWIWHKYGKKSWQQVQIKSLKMKNHLYHSRYKLRHVTKQLPLMHKKVADGFFFCPF